MIYLVAVAIAVYAVMAWVCVSKLRRSRRFGDARVLRRRSLFTVLQIIVVLAVTSAAGAVVEGATRALARTEAQRAADAAALAGAGHLIVVPGDVVGARRTAVEFANMNQVRGRAPELGPEDIVVDLDSGFVRVRLEARAYGIPVPIAWLLGTEQVSVWAEAKAEGGAARPGGGLFRSLRLVN